ncbi:porin family protein [Paraflavisolibacter sp. H34]|uniref:porin family protein n=1 Tax=Huijunlia imazamoxiresistens TaxID=3127457 RepID=UPI00301A7CC1
MKGKLVLFGLASALACTGAAAQGGAQLRAGVNFANVSVTDEGKVDDAKGLTSFHLGLIGDVAFDEVLSFQPGILFTGKGSKTESLTSKATSNIYYIEIPANLVFKVPLGQQHKFFFGAGPYLGIGVSGKTRIEYRGILGSGKVERNIEFSNDDPTTLNYQEGAGFGIVRRFDYGLNGTAGIESKGAVLAVGYGLGLAKLQSTADNSADNNNKHRVLGVSIGFKL